MFDINADKAVALLRTLLWIAIALPATAARPQDRSTPLTIDEAIRIGLAAAPEIRSSEAIAKGDESGLDAAGRLPAPELIAALDNVPVSGRDEFSLTDDFMTMQRIGLMQTFPNRQKRQLQRERASRGIDLARAELRSARFTLARNVADAWIARALAEQSLSRLKQLEPEVATQAAVASAAVASGRASVADALRVQALDARIEERLLAFEQEAQIRKSELERWIGDAAERPLAGIPTDQELAHSAEALIAAVPEHAPIAPLTARVAASQTDAALARAEKRPDWSAELAFANRGPDFSDMVSLEFRIGLPSLSGRRVNPEIARQVSIARAREQELEGEVRMHRAQIQATVASLQLGRRRLALYEQQLLPLARDRSRLAAGSYRAGQGALPIVFEAFAEEIEEQLAYVQLQGEVARAWVFLHLLHDSAVTTALVSNLEPAT
jgi:cobalt-zinc-cadmium efflux system outer membrane protein